MRRKLRVLFIFLDGVGLGPDDPTTNPFAAAHMPVLQQLLEGRKLTASAAGFEGDRASLLALDASLGVPGFPQSATGQAVLLTGTNVPKKIGEHYGPKPSPAIAGFLHDANLFSELNRNGLTAALLNAYPPRYFRAISSGKRLFSSIPLAATSAGLRLFNKEDFFAGRAMSADFTGAGWADVLGFPDAPILSPKAAGALLARLAERYDFALFEYWSTDYAGHKQDMPWALRQLAIFDEVLRGLLSASDDGQFILVTSDHGNLEDLSTRRHTHAPVPALVIGPRDARRNFSRNLRDLTGIAPAIQQILDVAP